MRVTDGQFHHLADRITDELRFAGMIEKGDRMVIEIGSKTYGRAYRLYRRANEGGGYSDSPLHLGDGFLGMTGDAAYRTVIGILRTLEAVSAHNAWGAKR